MAILFFRCLGKKGCFQKTRQFLLRNRSNTAANVQFLGFGVSNLHTTGQTNSPTNSHISNMRIVNDNWTTVNKTHSHSPFVDSLWTDSRFHGLFFWGNFHQTPRWLATPPQTRPRVPRRGWLDPVEVCPFGTEKFTTLLWCKQRGIDISVKALSTKMISCTWV